MWSSPGSPFWPRQCRNPLLLNEKVWVSVPFQGHWESGPPDTWSSLICEGIYGSSSSMQMESRCGPWSAWRLEQPAYGHLVTFGKTNQKSGEGRQSQFPFWELRLSLPTSVRFRRRLKQLLLVWGPEIDNHSSTCVLFASPLHLECVLHKQHEPVPERHHLKNLKHVISFYSFSWFLFSWF